MPAKSQYSTTVLGLCIGHTPLGGVVEQVVAALEAVVEGGVAPRGNDLDLGVDRVEGKLEADLVVAKMGVRRSRLSREALGLNSAEADLRTPYRSAIGVSISACKSKTVTSLTQP